MVAKNEAPLPPEELAAGLAEVYSVVGPLYRRVLRLVEHRAPDAGVSVGTRAALERLAETGTETVPAIARALALSRQFVQRSVNDACEQDLVTLQPNPAHRRSSLVELTEAGKAAIASVQAREHEAMAQVGGDLTGNELASTLRVLRHMLTALDEVSID